MGFISLIIVSVLYISGILSNPIVIYPIVILSNPIVVGFILGGIVSAIALFISNRLLDYCKKPILEFDEIRVRRSHIRSSGRPGEKDHVFFSSMIAIKNRGKSAAMKCKGKIEIGSNQERVCWVIPAERSTIVITQLWKPKKQPQPSDYLSNPKIAKTKSNPKPLSADPSKHTQFRTYSTL
jgi:hypothetical protein